MSEHIASFEINLERCAGELKKISLKKLFLENMYGVNISSDMIYQNFTIGECFLDDVYSVKVKKDNFVAACYNSHDIATFQDPYTSNCQIVKLIDRDTKLYVKEDLVLVIDFEESSPKSLTLRFEVEKE